MVEAAYNDIVKDKDDDKMLVFSSTVRAKSKKPIKALANISRNNDFNGCEDNFVETPRQSNRLRSTMNFGSANVSRTMNMRQSAQNVAQRRSLLAVNKEQHASNFASPTRNLFKTNKESLEDMLVRKLKQKYIDNNAAFSNMMLQDNETANLLSNNFMNNSAKATRRNHSKNATTLGSVDNAGSSRYRTKTSQHQALPKIRMSSIGFDKEPEQEINNQNTSLSPLRKQIGRQSMQGSARCMIQHSGSKLNLPMTLTPNGTQFLSYIKAEVSKFCASKRLTEATIRELDQKIQMECYLREKKEAILEDRKIEGFTGMKIIQNGHQGEVDAQSCLQEVQNKYQTLRDDCADDARSRRSHISKTASAIARSGAAQSMVGSAAFLRERLKQDFGICEPAEADKVSQISGLDDEIDEWAALNKYAVLKSFQDNQNKKLAAKDRQVKMREELERQQNEFRERQELFKLDAQKYAKELDARNQIQDKIDQNRREEKMRKIQEIKRWRVEHSKLREEFHKKQRDAQLKGEQKMVDDERIKNELNDIQKQKQRQSLLVQMKNSMLENHNQKQAVTEFVKAVKQSDLKTAQENENAAQLELVKQKKDQERRRGKVEKNQAAYMSKVVPVLEERKIKIDAILDRHVKQREARLDDDLLRKTNEKEMYKSNHFIALTEQTKAQKSQISQEKANMAELDRQQLAYTIARDEEKQQIRKLKENERRNHALNLLRETELKEKRLATLMPGALRGEKMTAEELRMNKESLKEVSKIKKEGNFNALLEQCASKKVTKFDA